MRLSACLVSSVKLPSSLGGPNSKHWFTTSFLWRKVPESDARSVALALSLSSSSCQSFTECWRCRLIPHQNELLVLICLVGLPLSASTESVTSVIAFGLLSLTMQRSLIVRRSPLFRVVSHSAQPATLQPATKSYLTAIQPNICP